MVTYEKLIGLTLSNFLTFLDVTTVDGLLPNETDCYVGVTVVILKSLSSSVISIV